MSHSHFSSVDTSPDPPNLIESLDRSAAGLAAMKTYIAAAAARAAPGGLVLDLGCGVGHDLGLLAASGLHPVGLDASAVMVDEVRRRLAALGTPIVQGRGEHLPFAPGSFDGCRVERVLQHVDDPEVVLAEVVRVLRPGGVLAAFEPDWESLRFETELDDATGIGAQLHRPRQPDIGNQLTSILRASGCEVLDVVTETSFGESLDAVPVPVERSLRRAVAEQRIEERLARRWLAEQQQREVDGHVRATWVKTLVVARRR